MKRERILLVLGVAVLIGLAVFFWPREQDAPAPVKPTPAEAKPIAEAPMAPPVEVEYGGRSLPTLPPMPGQFEGSALGLEQARDGYIEFARFPPWSRPATPTFEELYKFNKAGPEHQQPIGAIGATEVHARIALDRFFVEPGRPATITVECWTETNGERAEIDYNAIAEVHLAHDEATDDPNETTAFMFGYHAIDGQQTLTRDPNNAAIRTGKLAVEQLPSLAGGPVEARLVVYYEPEGGEMRPLAVNFAFSAKAPIRILGVKRDEIVNGSLELTFDVDVIDAVPIRVRGALAQAGRIDEPIAIYDDWFRPTEPGTQTMKLTFFGKILYDAELDGPYEVFSLHGVAYYAKARVTDVFWQEDRTFRTRAHEAKDFSPDEWQSPEKDAKLRNYEQVIDGLRTQ